MTSTPDPALIAKGLTEAQTWRLLSFGTEPKQMGIGLMQFLPGCLEPDGSDHPIFGPHYRLTPLGEQVRAALKAIASQYQGDDHE